MHDIGGENVCSILEGTVPRSTLKSNVFAGPMQEHHVQINPDWDPKVNANFMGTVVNFITLLYILLYVGAACMFLMR